jgi:hypothetical protein
MTGKDRCDRRKTFVIGDLLRSAFQVSIPYAPTSTAAAISPSAGSYVNLSLPRCYEFRQLPSLRHREAALAAVVIQSSINI